VLPSDGAVYVGNYLDLTVSVINPATNTVTKTFGLGSGNSAFSLAASVDSSMVFAVTAGLTIINTATNTVTTTVTIPGDPEGVFVLP